ncbi:MAG: hypothetical protein V4501_11100, partial [Pseudomonadota bacterium]
MRKEDENKFGQLMSTIAAHYKSELSVLIIDMYWESLKQYTYEEVRDATFTHLKDVEKGQFMPKIADLIGIIQTSKGTDSKTAWLEVMNEIRRVGSYSAPNVPERSLEAIRRIGGWRNICAM